MQTITIKIELPIERTKDAIICYSLKSLSMVLGTTSISGNYHVYHVERLKNPTRWKVPLEDVKNQILKKQARFRKELETVEIMQQIVGTR